MFGAENRQSELVFRIICTQDSIITGKQAKSLNSHLKAITKVGLVVQWLFLFLLSSTHLDKRLPSLPYHLHGK